MKGSMIPSNDTSVMHRFRGSSTVSERLLDQDEPLINLEQKRYNSKTTAAALIASDHSSASECREAVIARGGDLEDVARSRIFGSRPSLAHRAVLAMMLVADNSRSPHPNVSRCFGTLARTSLSTSLGMAI